MRNDFFVVTPRWQTVANLVSLSALIVAGMLIYNGLSAWWLLISFIVYSAFNIAVSVGYHQLFTHRSFKTSKFWELVFAIVGTLAFQGSPLAWAHLHFVHHRTSDTEKDPHVRSLWFFLIKWYHKVDMPASMIVKRFILDPVHRFLHFYGILLCIGVAAGLCLIDPLVLLFGYLVPVGYFFLAIACHQIFTHVGNTPRNVYWLIPIFPWGDWIHEPHHRTPNDWQKGGWCLSYYIIPWIAK